MAEAVSIEATPDNPILGTPEENAQKAGLSAKGKENLLKIRQKYIEMWSLPRRVAVRNILRKFEYVKGNQYISFDPYNFAFYDPFDTSTSGSQQGNDDGSPGDIYCYVTNVVQWLLRVFVASLGGTLPATRFSPSDSTSDLDNRTAENASRANALVERWNNAKKMLKQRLCYLALGGVYFRHTRWVRDSRICGTMKEPVHEMRPTQVWPSHYHCQGCNTQTPATPGQAMTGSQQCQNCGQPLSSEDFFPEYNTQMPVITGFKEVPKGQVRQNVYCSLQVQIAPWDDGSGQDPLTNTPILDLSVEMDKAALRANFPNEWAIGEASGEGGNSADGDLDRMARLRANIPGLTRGSGLMTSGQLPTYSRTWIQPLAFNSLEEQADAEELKKAFPNGCVLVSVNGKFYDAQKDPLSEAWTMCTTGILPGPNSPAVLDPAMDFQDRINDIGNSTSEYFDRLASPSIIYDSKMITKGMNGRFMAPSSFFPAPANPQAGRKLSDSFFQPTFHIDNGWKDYMQLLVQYCQLLVGITPQMYGGHQQGIDTKGGQEQALDVATGINKLYWDQVREEDAQAAKLAVKCLADNATEDQFNVVDGDTGQNSYKNEDIEIENLKGEFNAFPDEEQGYPISFEETREMLQNIIEQSAKNELVQELFQPMSNRRYFARFLAPGLEIPGQNERYKVLKDIAMLMQGTPMPAQGPMGEQIMMPSVVPDKDFDNLEVSQEAVQEFAEKNYELAKQRPVQFQNLRLYFTLCAQYSKEKAMEQASPVMPPGGGGPPTVPGAGAPPSGATTPPVQ